MSEETMTPTEGSGNLTVNESVSGFESFLDSQENPAKDNSEGTSEEAVEEVAEEEVTEEVESEEVEPEEVESEEETFEEESDEEEVEGEEEELETYTVKASGEEKQVTFDELVQGYQLGADYTKKTQELAENRKLLQAEAQAINEAKQLRDQYAQGLQQMQQMVMDTGASEEDLTYLKENDPLAYATKVAENTEKKEQLQKLNAERARIAQEQQAEQLQIRQKQIALESQKLQEIIPEFSDKAKGEKIRAELRNYGKSVGFQDQELNQIYDSRQVDVLHKAYLYDKLQKSKPGVKKKVAQAPKMLKSGTKKAKNNNDVTRRQKAQLKGSGKVADAAKLFENFI